LPDGTRRKWKVDMTALASSPQTELVAPEAQSKSRGSSTLARVARYTAVRIVSLFITIVLGVYLTILIANMGGYVDEIQLGVIQEQVGASLQNNLAYRQMSREGRPTSITSRDQAHRLGLISRL
jgi:peptide/nickel transport system permease protein